MSSGAAFATVAVVGEIDVMTPYAELTELRSLLTVAEIAEMTGLRRETLSRARADSRFQRRTAKGLHDLYVVTRRLRPLVGGDVHLAAVLRRPQAALGERSIAELLREGKAEVVLGNLPAGDALGGDAPAGDAETGEGLRNLRLGPAVEARLAPWEEPPEDSAAENSAVEAAVSDLLAAEPGLASRIAAIEAKVRDRFGPGTSIERAVIGEPEAAVTRDGLYLRVRTDLPFDEEIDRLRHLLRDEEALLAPVRRALTIGFL